MKHYLIYSLFAVLCISLTSCGKDNDEPQTKDTHNEQELITTVELSIIGSGSTTAQVFEFNDPDGDGGEDATVDNIVLNYADAPFTVNIRFLDQSDSTDVEDITAEILEEANDHLVCQTSSSGALTIAVLDADNAGLPLGLESSWNVTDGVSGSLTVVLKHQPGEKNGSCDVGETDVEVVFPISIN